MRRTELVVFAAHVGVAVTQLVVFAILGSGFGPDVLGTYALPLAIATPVFLLLGLSLRVLYVTAEVEWSVAWFMRCTLATVGVCALVGGGIQLVSGAHLPFALAILTVKSFDLVQMAGLGVLHRNGRLATGSAFLLGNAGVSCVLAGGAAIASLSASSVVWASAAGSVMAGVAIWIFIHVKLRLKGGPRGDVLLLVRRGIPLGITAATLNTAINLPTYALAATGNIGALATYSVLSNLRSAVNMGYGTVAQTRLHAFSESVRGGEISELRSQLKTALTAVLVIGIAISVLAVVAGPFVVPLIFGVEAENWTVLLLYVSVGFLASGLIYVCDAGLSAFQRYYQQVWTAGAALVVTALFLLLIGSRIDLISSSVALSLALCSAALCKVGILARAVVGTRRKN